MEIESKHHNFILAGFIVILVLEVTELLGYVVANYLATKGVLYWAQSEEGLENNSARRRPVLGWVIQKNDSEVDAVGSRLISEYPGTGNPYVSFLGDFFTWSSEVESASAWNNLLSILLKCRVNNFSY